MGRVRGDGILQCVRLPFRSTVLREACLARLLVTAVGWSGVAPQLSYQHHEQAPQPRPASTSTSNQYHSQ